MSFQSLFTDEPRKQWVAGLGYEGGSWRIKPTSFLEDDADPRFPAFQKAWREGIANDRMFGTDPFKLHGSVGGSGVDNHRPDVAKVESFLADAGYYKPLTEDGPSGYHNTALDTAIRSFQKDNGLTVDGVLKPEGPTINALKAEFGSSPDPSSTRQTGALPPTKSKPIQVAQVREPGEMTDDAPQQEANAAAARLFPLLAPAAIIASETARRMWDRDKGNTAPPSPNQPTGPEAPIAGAEPSRPPNPPAIPDSAPSDSTLEHPMLDDVIRKELFRPLESRGDAMTQKGNDIVVEECTAIIKAEFPELGARLRHVGGASKDGKGAEKVKEEAIKNSETQQWKGGSRADVTFQFGDSEADRFRINTTTMSGNSMTGRELASFNNLLRNIGSDLAAWVPKLRPGMDEDEYRAKVRKMCREVAGRWRDRLQQDGKLPKADEEKQ